MTMDYSHSHTYTPPQCAGKNTGYTYSLSSSYSSSALEHATENRAAAAFVTPTMSRRSLRIHTTGGHYGDDSLLDSSLNHSVTYTSSSTGQRESRVLKSRRQHQSLSGSQLLSGSHSLLYTPRKSQSSAALQAHTSLHSCAASDSSLLSTLLDESCIQERTLVDSFWGLDEETDRRDQSLRADRSMTALNGDMNSAQTQTSVMNGYICGDCSFHSERKDSLTACSSSKSSASRSASTDSASAVAAVATLHGLLHHLLPATKAANTSLLATATNRFLSYSRRALASVVSIVTLLVHNIPLHRLKEGRGALASLSESCLCFSRRAASSVVSLATPLVHNVLLKMRREGSDVGDQAHQRYCGSVNVKHLMASDGQLSLNGSLCDDCKGKQHLETLAVQTQSSRTGRLKGALWRAVAFAGNGLLRAARALGSAGGFVARSLLSVLWLAAVSPGKTATGAFWWLGTAWYQLVTLVSLLNVFILTRVLPKLYKLMLFLLPFLLLLGLWYWFPSGLLSYLPAVNLTQWSTASLLPWAWTPAPSAPLEEHIHPTTALPPTATQGGALHRPPAVSQQEGVAAGSVDTERLLRLEQRLAQLWEGVESGGRMQESQHKEVLGLYASLREQLDRQTDRDSMGLWVSGLLDQRLGVLRSELQQGMAPGEQAQQQYMVQQQSHESRLAEMEMLLQVLAAKTEELLQRPETATPAPVSVGVDSEAHIALLGQVQRLEVELGRIRQDLQGVIGCQGRCDQLGSLQETVSAQIKQELRALFYGAARAEEEGAELPEPLLQWLSAQFVRDSDLQATLVSLESSILRNLSLQLEQSRQPPCAEAIAQSVAHATEAAGMSEKHVQLIVKNALNLYSQDRTGLVDYALESGGGSVLSTRCSETYETKTALMSLFGLPLWYFSQSPRVVIQPDVYPGNCWAFKGSQGYLVIRLSLSVRPTAFSLEHIPKSLSPTGNISSAPCRFSVYGLDDETQEEGKALGHYTYQEDGDALQTFPVSEQNDQLYQIIEMRVLSNWGHQEYTCLYRFRVHGEPERT
ncbi:hypothetical protein SKAU_G00119240 [Synaphobranchus kaupii]|uniref:SUN domain-containing protein n=1 Tax=Synaphobranchus kaupii TaxID=118154 RepID=A0A9Q1J281_SYNKA|nr:hypothetical protein SKAU_G00119240 [Synaphobranchus kaupii]